MSKEIPTKHAYYASDNNFYSNECSNTYPNVAAFLAGWKDADRDYNAVFRFDVRGYDEWEKPSPTGEYEAHIVIIGQRKGIYISNTIQTVTDETWPVLRKWLEPFWQDTLERWAPISQPNPDEGSGT